MFKTNNEKIGKQLGDLIKKSEYKNDRQVCMAYLTLRDVEANTEDAKSYLPNKKWEKGRSD